MDGRVNGWVDGGVWLDGWIGGEQMRKLKAGRASCPVSCHRSRQHPSPHLSALSSSSSLLVSPPTCLAFGPSSRQRLWAPWQEQPLPVPTQDPGSLPLTTQAAPPTSQPECERIGDIWREALTDGEAVKGALQLWPGQTQAPGAGVPPSSGTQCENMGLGRRRARGQEEKGP